MNKAEQFAELLLNDGQNFENFEELLDDFKAVTVFSRRKYEDDGRIAYTPAFSHFDQRS